jgi:hypothetical protein
MFLLWFWLVWLLLWLMCLVIGVLVMKFDVVPSDIWVVGQACYHMHSSTRYFFDRFRSDSLCASIRFFRKDSQSCCIRIPLVSHWFVIRIYSFFAMSRSHVIFAFRWFRSYSLFASIRFSQWFAVMLYSHYVGFAFIRYSHLFVFRNDSQS